MDSGRSLRGDVQVVVRLVANHRPEADDGIVAAAFREVFGGDRQLVGDNKIPDPAGITVNHDHAAEVLPLLRELPIARTWAGLMPFSLDGAPLIGKLPQYNSLYIVSGLASSGFGRGPMAGKLLADYIHSGHRHPVLAEADPARCVTLGKETSILTAAPRNA